MFENPSGGEPSGMYEAGCRLIVTTLTGSLVATAFATFDLSFGYFWRGTHFTGPGLCLLLFRGLPFSEHSSNPP